MAFNTIKKLSNNKKTGILCLGVIATLVGGYALVGAQSNTVEHSAVVRGNDNNFQQKDRAFNDESNRPSGFKQNEQFSGRNRMMTPQNNGEQTPPNFDNSNRGNTTTPPNFNNSTQSNEQAFPNFNQNGSSKKGKQSSTIDQSIFDRNNE